jgi:hypothetical protein
MVSEREQAAGRRASIEGDPAKVSMAATVKYEGAAIYSGWQHARATPLSV